MSTFEVAVATIGKAHGLKGEVALILRTDQPEERLAPGSEFAVEVGGVTYPLTVAKTRVQQGRWYVRFVEITDRGLAEGLRGAELTTEVDEDEEAEDDAWYPSQLRGLEVRTPEGEVLGSVLDLEHYPAQDLLIVRTPDKRRVMLPFVTALVPEVNVADGYLVATPPGGLFDPEDA
ncbi:ribosome maturation factor RimM [Dermabacteraceae bacterium P7006]